MMNGFRCFASRSIHAFNFIADMPVIIFLCELGRGAVARSSDLASQFKHFRLWPIIRTGTDLKMEIA